MSLATDATSSLQVLSSSSFPRRLHAARRGNRAAQQELFEQYYKQVERMAHAQLQRGRGERDNRLAARFSTSDVVQEVFCSLLANLEQFRGSTEGEFVTYVAKVIRCRVLDAIRFHVASCRDYRRTPAGKASVVLESACSGPVDPRASHDESELRSDLNAALGELPATVQGLLRGRLERGLGYERLAKELGYSSRYAARRAFYSAQAGLILRLKRQGSRTRPGPN